MGVLYHGELTEDLNTKYPSDILKTLHNSVRIHPLFDKMSKCRPNLIISFSNIVKLSRISWGKHSNHICLTCNKLVAIELLLKFNQLRFGKFQQILMTSWRIGCQHISEHIEYEAVEKCVNIVELTHPAT